MNGLFICAIVTKCLKFFNLQGVFMQKWLLSFSLVLVSTLSACSTYSTVPHQVGVAGPSTQQRPESLVHWKVLAEQLANDASSKLSGVVVSSSISPATSYFDKIFQEFFITALHERGVQFAPHGANIEITSYPITFPSHPNYIKNSEGYRGYAPMFELGVNVRISNKNQLFYSGSKTYYLPEGDALNYFHKSQGKNGRHVRIIGE